MNEEDILPTLLALAPSARIERLRRHAQLIAKADELADWYETTYRRANAVLLLAITEAEKTAYWLDVRPTVTTGTRVRQPFAKANADRKRQAIASHALWQRKAATLWAKHPGMSATSIARLIDPKHVDTVRRHIHRPTKIK